MIYSVKKGSVKMQLLVKKDGDTLYAVLAGEIDHHEAVELRSRLDSIIMTERPKKLVFDFSKVTFMDSSGIGLVLGRYRVMASFNGKTVIKGTNDAIGRIFTMSGINKILEIL